MAMSEPGTTPALGTARVPTSTYRIQFHKGCGFAQVTAIVPYLHALGIGDLYSSPYLKARAGSTHGYDIVDHDALNPEVGTESEHEALCRALREHGMGQLLDVVPNHMGVLEADNGWWLEMLEHGQASPHAETFDIEWANRATGMAGRVLLPVLGDHYGVVLEAGEIVLHFDAEAGTFELRYWSHRFPIDPATYPMIFNALPGPVGEDDAPGRAELAQLLQDLSQLPSRDASEPAARQVRLQGSVNLKRTLASLVARDSALAARAEACVQRLNGTVGDPSSFDALDALIDKQAYRLANWRAASDDVNYRRFFDVNTLAAVRMEREPVFEATHKKLLQWLRDGRITALRIDHPDGLSDPQSYFDTLQRRYNDQLAAIGEAPRALYLLVEKIQAEHEALPATWPVHGDTGYRFAALVNGLFVDGRNAAALLDDYKSFTGRGDDFDTTAHAAKRLIIETSLYSEIGWLTKTLHRITRVNRRRRDFTRNRLRNAMAEVAACFPVYRTYLRAGEAASDTDRRHLDWAIAAARRKLGPSEDGVLDHLREVLLGEDEGAVGDEARRTRFLARWQQFTAPVMAKAVEDTTFYRHIPLLSLNDVGSDPRSFGLSTAAFHVANQARARFWPHAMLGTSTHDSKRGEDLRARIDVLSEDLTLWHTHLERMTALAQMFERDTPAGKAPTRNDVWLLFQTLAGLWPAEPPDEAALADLRERVQAYMLKAVREAKLSTSWTWPNEEYEAALAHYIASVLRPGANPFADELQRLTTVIAPFGFRNSLSQLALKLTVPGVPDIYQGCEQWTFSLVDPDNRRPVDFAHLARELDEVQRLYEGDGWPTPAQWTALCRNAADGRVKLLATWRLLQLRRSMPELFRDGSYLPLAVDGPAADHTVAFARTGNGAAVLVIATRLAYRLCAGEAASWRAALWSGTHIATSETQAEVGRVARWRNCLTGASADGFEATEGAMALDAVFAGAGGLPFAVLVGA